MGVLPAYMSDTHIGSKKVPDLLELETVSCPTQWARNGTWVLYKDKKNMLLSISPVPKIVFLKHQSLFSSNYFL